MSQNESLKKSLRNIYIKDSQMTHEDAKNIFEDFGFKVELEFCNLNRPH
jgi:hypothetical protein